MAPVDATADAGVSTTTELPATIVDGPPADGAPEYRLEPARFVLEPVLRVLGVPVLRARIAARQGLFVLGEERHLAVELLARSLRTGVPGLAKLLTGEGGLCANEFPVLRFTSTMIDPPPDETFEIAGRLEVLDIDRELRLFGRLVHADDRSVVLWAKGVLQPPRRPPRRGSWPARLIVSRPLRIEVAAEFIR